MIILVKNNADVYAVWCGVLRSFDLKYANEKTASI